MAKKLYFLLILAIAFFLCMINFSEAANRKPKPRAGCGFYHKRCLGNFTNTKAIISTQTFIAVTNSTTEFYKAVAQISTNTTWASNATRARQIAEDCTGFGVEAVEQLTECNEILWNNNKAWNNTSKWNKTTTSIKQSVSTYISAAMTDLDTCMNGFVEAEFVMPAFLQASMEAAQSLMSQVLEIVKNLTTPS